MPRLQFNIKFRTQFGQELQVMGNCAVLGQLNQEEAIPMIFLDEETWQLEIEIRFVVKLPSYSINMYLKIKMGP